VEISNIMLLKLIKKLEGREKNKIDDNLLDCINNNNFKFI
jgi:hypothetical protein